MNGQDYVALAIVALSVAYVARRFLAFVRRSSGGGCPGCGDCSATQAVEELRREREKTRHTRKEHA